MAIYQITKEFAPSIKSYCPQSVLSNVGMEGFTTLAYFDEDEFLAGILQFSIGDSKTGNDICAIITYLYVQETFRRCQIATLLLDQLVDVARSAGISLIEVDLINGQKSMEELKDFFLSYNFDFCDAGQLYSALAKEYLKFPALQALPKSEIHDLTDISKEQFAEELKRVISKDYPVSLDLDDYEKKVSSYFFNGSSTCFFLLQKRATDVLEIVLFAATENTDNSKKLDLILSSAKKVRELYNSHTIIRVVAKTKDSQGLLNYLCPDIDPIDMLKGRFVIDQMTNQ